MEPENAAFWLHNLLGGLGSDELRARRSSRYGSTVGRELTAGGPTGLPTETCSTLAECVRMA